MFFRFFIKMLFYNILKKFWSFNVGLFCFIVNYFFERKKEIYIYKRKKERKKDGVVNMFIYILDWKIMFLNNLM